MPRWLPKTLRRVRELASARRVLFTLKARRELANLGIGLDEDDACEMLALLRPEESAGRLRSEATGEWMYLFKPTLGGALVYVKLILRSNCVVVSFHEDEDGKEQQAQ